MKKKFLIFALMLMAMGMSFTVVSCSSDDEYDDIVLPPIEGEGWQTTDSTGSDDIIVNFRLTKSDGTPANQFRWGENICFDLMIQNNTNDTIHIDHRYYSDSNRIKDVSLGKNLFGVYHSNGKYVGCPFEDTTGDIEKIYVVYFSDKKEIRLTLPSYSYDKDYPSAILNHYITGNWEPMNILLPGLYYTEFKLQYYPTIEDNKLNQKREHTFKVYFKIN